ncbi:hypothetical protein OG946_15675 [Streptomyces sp. NBC_01808]|uniref:hypothetical protein n=1 Tax=Streptomyces sp. NBC_01808 TaxID=2975947 RepID=UPI002DD81843|nr:hypothetical protein [Streptomyces sp. NBC_01808]WSA38694.1 hypothetical protein OG946_15675 [Streptomyces sp. NBC_01808]
MEDGAYDAARQARANFVDVQGRNAIVDGTRGDVHLGDHHHYTTPRADLPRLVTGTVPRDELRRLRLVFEEPPGYPELRGILERQRLIALCGDTGSGRGYAALSLLDEITRGQVERMDPRTELDRIAEADLAEGRGYLVQIADQVPLAPRWRPDADDRDRPERDGRWVAERPAELHLDRLGALLARRGAYAILVVGTDAFGDELLRGRYGHLFRTASADGMLRRHLTALLGHAEEEPLAEALALARRPDVTEALGLDPLRPHEVESLARLLVARLRAESTDDELLAGLRTFAPSQARAWFATTGRAATRGRDAVAGALRQAAFRTAAAVYNGSPYSVATSAAEQLAWEFAQAAEPGREPGRVLFGDHSRARLAAARAELFTGDVLFADGRRLETRKVRLQGGALARAVLAHVWEEHHNVRGPLCQWLRTQCADERPVAWVPAAITAGALCTLDFSYALQEIVLPLASDEFLQQQLAAATTLAQAAALSEPLRVVVRHTVRGWAREDDDARAGTAALVHGFGTVAESVSASLDELGRMAGRQYEGPDPIGLGYGALSAARLLAGAEPETVLKRLGAWMGDRRTSHRNLALITVDYMILLHTSRLWGLQDTPARRDHERWPLAAALLDAHPRLTRMLGDLVWCGLDTARSRDRLEDSLAEWIRNGDEDPQLLDVLCAFLPHALYDEDDAARLRNLVRRLERDPDEPVAPATVRRLREAIAGQRAMTVRTD